MEREFERIRQFFQTDFVKQLVLSGLACFEFLGYHFWRPNTEVKNIVNEPVRDIE